MTRTEDQEVLERARGLAMEGDYAVALSLIGTVLDREPNCVQALLLKGNVIELKIYDAERGGQSSFVNSPDMEKARVCYKKILLRHPRNIRALVDLGTNWKNSGHGDKAMPYYDKVIALSSRDGAYQKSDEFLEALEGKVEILEACGDTEGVLKIRKVLEQAG